MKNIFALARTTLITSLLVACSITLFAQHPMPIELSGDHDCNTITTYSNNSKGFHACSAPLEIYTILP